MLYVTLATLLIYVYRFIIAFGIALVFRPNVMWDLSVDQFKETIIENKDAFLYSEIIVSQTGGSNTKNGGIKSLSRTPVRIPLFHIDFWTVG